MIFSGKFPLIQGCPHIAMCLGDQFYYTGNQLKRGYMLKILLFVLTRVDSGGLAEELGLQVGDHILEVNGHSFMRITHGRAVDAIQSQRRLMLTVKVQTSLWF